eukprot:508950-Rhodomonas_salina.3
MLTFTRRAIRGYRRWAQSRSTPRPQGIASRLGICSPDAQPSTEPRCAAARWGRSWWKEWINEYTVANPICLRIRHTLSSTDDAVRATRSRWTSCYGAVREGTALFQTALVHTAETHRGGKHKLKQSDGEAAISSLGGVGALGTFGDVLKTKVRTKNTHASMHR